MRGLLRSAARDAQGWGGDVGPAGPDGSAQARDRLDELVPRERRVDAEPARVAVPEVLAGAHRDAAGPHRTVEVGAVAQVGARIDPDEVGAIGIRDAGARQLRADDPHGLGDVGVDDGQEAVDP